MSPMSSLSLFGAVFACVLALGAAGCETRETTTKTPDGDVRVNTQVERPDADVDANIDRDDDDVDANIRLGDDDDDVDAKIRLRDRDKGDVDADAELDID